MSDTPAKWLVRLLQEHEHFIQPGTEYAWVGDLMVLTAKVAQTFAGEGNALATRAVRDLAEILGTHFGVPTEDSDGDGGCCTRA